jgi:hypothetical protein
MEFLMTYGWAILVVLVSISALAYFGVLSPTKFLPEMCQMPAGITCVDHQMIYRDNCPGMLSGNSNDIIIVVSNNKGSKIEVTGWNGMVN